MSFSRPAFAVLLLGVTSIVPAAASDCRNSGDFAGWLAAFRTEALQAGIKPATAAGALGDVTFDESVINRDRKQGFFAQSFLDFQAKLATPNRVTTGRQKLQEHAAIFARAEKIYGVPGPVITAFWALESDFGAITGKRPILRALATLAYDCRRGAFFRGELMAALRIIDRGDLKPEQMIGSWAGEIGQTQFLPSKYEKFAIDFDGDGRRDLLRSTADVIGSTAAYVQSLGWRRGEPWIEEVRVPADLDWSQADLTIKMPRAKWGAWGVTRIDGTPLPNDTAPASLLLLMGRNGPAFLTYANFDAYLQWNESLTYTTTAAYLATRLQGAPPVSRGRAPVETMSLEDLKTLQSILSRRGHDVGKIDGVVGAKTRAAVKVEQRRTGLPEDAYPTPELLARLRGS